MYKYVTTILKNVYIDELPETVKQHKNATHRTIKTKPVNIKPELHIDLDVEINTKYPRFRVP